MLTLLAGAILIGIWAAAKRYTRHKFDVSSHIEEANKASQRVQAIHIARIR